MKIKICGIRTEKDLQIAINAGADAVGFITEVPVDSPRRINLADSTRLIKKVPVFITSVLVIMPENAEQAIRMINIAKPSAVQIHNILPLPELAKIKDTGVKLIKTITVSQHADTELLLDLMRELSGTVDAVLLDSAADGKIGGTGMPHNWKISSEIVLRASMPVILAGGLRAENVKEAVRCVHPYAVDTASGVETNGQKDESKIIEFINNARNA